ncbi:MAG: hypothetical protein ACRDZW_00660 [Acidimicrobiales bacterium]
MTVRVADQRFGLAGSRGFIATVAGVVTTAGAGLGAVRFVGGSPAERGVTGVLGAVAMGAVVAASGLLALLALADRPALLLPASLVLLPLSLLSFALVTLPLIVPAEMLFVAYRRRSAGLVHRRLWTPAAVIMPIALLFAATVALFAHQDPRSYTRATSSGSTSDVITGGEALLSLAFTASAVAAGWVLAGLATPRERPAPWTSL